MTTAEVRGDPAGVASWFADSELHHEMTSDQARHAHQRYWQQLKGSPAPW